VSRKWVKKNVGPIHVMPSTAPHGTQDSSPPNKHGGLSMTCCSETRSQHGLPDGRQRSRRAFSIAKVFALVVLLGYSANAGQGHNVRSLRIEGLVKDQTGASVPHAQVTLSAGTFQQVLFTDREGKFTFGGIRADAGTLTVRASGFATFHQGWKARDQELTRLEIVLAPEPLAQIVTVTATRAEERLSDTAASVTVLTPQDLSSTAALTLDGALRQLPGFTLFRRTGSLTVNPTTQGVSLRGVGASGASRGLVLADGIPLNDPFGGWVYWDRVPKASVEAIEIVQGGISDLYGTDALGGVVNLIPHQAHDSSLELEAGYGNERTPEISLFTSLRKGGWAGSLSAEALGTDGYILVDDRDRGSVDTPANSQHETAEFTLERVISERARVFARGSIFRETRDNGTPLQINRTHLRQVALGGEWQSPAAGGFSFRLYGGPQLFNQVFSSVSPDRNGETLICHLAAFEGLRIGCRPACKGLSFFRALMEAQIGAVGPSIPPPAGSTSTRMMSRGS
jgi:hypothetical protein